MKETIMTVTSNAAIARATYRMEIHCPDPGFFEAFLPGRFIQVRVPNADGLLLRRPFAVETICPERNAFTLAYVVCGQGTAALAEASSGAAISILGPLGKPFDAGEHQKIWLLGGSVGIAPLHSIAQAHPDRQYHSFVGFASAADAFDLSDMAAYGDVTLCTDDASGGYGGFAVDAAMEALDSGHLPDVIFACGPGKMFAALDRALAARNYPVPCFISMESRMGCGTGVCLVCNCKRKAENGDWQYVRACLDGPVFPIQEVIFDEIM